MKKSYKKLICIFMSLFILLSALPLTVHAVGATVHDVGTPEALRDVCAAINANGGEHIINLTADITGGNIEISKSDADVTVYGNGHIIFNPITAVSVSTGAKVTLSGGTSTLTLKGNDAAPTDAATNDNPGLIYVLSGSTCIMNDNVTLTERRGSNYLGGGVTVEGGTFIMNGGTIEKCGIDGGSVCYGGGVAVFEGGYFEMNGGTIKECYVESVGNSWQVPLVAGGGVFVYRASFTMNGGTIENCTATNYEDSDEIDAVGGGVAVITSLESVLDKRNYGYLDSDFTMNGGTIKNCSATMMGGALAAGMAYANYDPMLTAYTPHSSGNNPGIYLNGGSMIENDANNGGAIFLNWIRSDITVSIKNLLIDSNSAYEGGAIDVTSYWTQAHIDNCTITNNTAEGIGGGVCLNQAFINGYILNQAYIKDTTITNNTSKQRGAGVYYNETCQLYLSGNNNIQDNTYNSKLNNLNIYMKNGTVCPVYVNGDLTGSQIGLSDPTLWDDGKEDYAPDAVSTEYLTSGYKENNPEVHPSEYFTSDHETWIVDRSVKTITEEQDERSAYRLYTVERHPVESIGKYLENQAKYFAPYAGNKDQYDISDIQKPELKNKSSLTQAEIIEELAYRFSDEDKYVFADNSSTYVNDHVKYTYTPKADTPLASSTLSSIVLEKKHNENDKITLSYNAKSQMGNMIRSGSVTYTASASNQPYPGKLLLQINSNGTSYLNDDYYRFSDDYTETTVEYANADFPIINNTNVYYEYDKETGDIIAKLIPKSFITKYAKSTIIETGTDEEVRLIRVKPNYHINNDEIKKNYQNDDIFTDEVEAAINKEIKVGETITKFYTIPEATPTQENSCPYIFKGWYYDQDNDNDDNPVNFGTDYYSKDIYAHWITVENVAKNGEDDNELPDGETEYGGFDLAGVQVREGIRDTNFDGRRKPGGLRFVTSLNTDVVEAINDIQPNNIEYGYVAATNEGWIRYHREVTHNKLQYVSKTANGIDTSNTATDENYFDFAKNINCTSKAANSKGVVELDHRNFSDYLLYTLVITYQNEETQEADHAKNVLARPYIRYTDANGLERVAYSEYRGNSNTLGGCYTSYNANAGAGE